MTLPLAMVEMVKPECEPPMHSSPFSDQTSSEISFIKFLGSPENSIFYSITRFFFIRKQYCAAARMQWQKSPGFKIGCK